MTGIITRLRDQVVFETKAGAFVVIAVVFVASLDVVTLEALAGLEECTVIVVDVLQNHFCTGTLHWKACIPVTCGGRVKS